jgi:hypothetical protein
MSSTLTDSTPHLIMCYEFVLLSRGGMSTGEVKTEYARMHKRRAYWSTPAYMEGLGVGSHTSLLYIH